MSPFNEHWLCLRWTVGHAVEVSPHVNCLDAGLDAGLDAVCTATSSGVAHSYEDGREGSVEITYSFPP